MQRDSSLTVLRDASVECTCHGGRMQITICIPWMHFHECFDKARKEAYISRAKKTELHSH